ncbi:MAG: MltA-interacting protein [Candidatus Erwinia impunctatus]
MATSLSVQADEFSLGAAALMTSNPYVGSKDQVFPVPVLGYEGEIGYFRGLTGGIYLWNDEVNTLSINAYYLPMYFKPADSDVNAMKRLDKRRSTLMAGVGYRYKNPFWDSFVLKCPVIRSITTTVSWVT